MKLVRIVCWFHHDRVNKPYDGKIIQIWVWRFLFTIRGDSCGLGMSWNFFWKLDK